MVQIVIGAQILGIVVTLIALRLLITGNASREHLLMAYFLSGSLVQNVGYLLELTASSMDVAIMAVRIENLGSTFVPLCYSYFIFEYCYEKVPVKLMKLLGIMDFLTLPVLFWLDKHPLIYRQIDWIESPYGYHYLSLTYGPLYMPVIVIRVFIPYLLTIYALVHTILIRSSRREKGSVWHFL